MITFMKWFQFMILKQIIQSSYQDSLLSGNNDGTIPLSQGHALSNCKIANMNKKNPDPGNSMYDEPDSFYNQYEKEFSMHVEQYYTQNILYINWNQQTYVI